VVKTLIILSFLSTFILCCGTASDGNTIKEPTPTVTAPKRLQSKAEQIERFTHDFPVIIRTTIKFIPSFASGVAAICDRYYDKITISSEWWDNPNISELERRYLVWHELGHCEMDLNHNTTMNLHVKNSIMHPVMADLHEIQEMAQNPKLDDFSREFFHTLTEDDLK